MCGMKLARKPLCYEDLLLGHPTAWRSPTWLYRYFADDGALLYIGITGCFRSRDYNHFSQSKWRIEAARAEVELFPSRRMADIAEANATVNERPIFNVKILHTALGADCPKVDLWFFEKMGRKFVGARRTYVAIDRHRLTIIDPPIHGGTTA